MKKINFEELNINPYTLFAKMTPICVFGSLENHNGLTIGWGSLGSLWRKSIATVYVKPTRYSYEFAEKEEYFSIVWFDDQNVINTFGSKSGRDYNKDELCKLNPYELDNCVAYKEAKMIITCRKIYQNNIEENKIIDNGVVNMPLYADKLFHHEYIGEIIGVYIKN